MIPDARADIPFLIASDIKLALIISPSFSTDFDASSEFSPNSFMPLLLSFDPLEFSSRAWLLLSISH